MYCGSSLSSLNTNIFTLNVRTPNLGIFFHPRLVGSGTEICAPSLGSIFLIFMNFAGKNGQIMDLTPLLDILDPQLVSGGHDDGFGNFIYPVSFLTVACALQATHPKFLKDVHFPNKITPTIQSYI